MKYEKILYDIIENEVKRIKEGLSMNTYGIGLLGAKIACREIADMYFSEVLETVNFVDVTGSYISAILFADGGVMETDGSVSAHLYDFMDNISRYVVKHFTREFIEYIDKLCDELRLAGYEVVRDYGNIVIVYGENSVKINVMNVLYAKSLGLSSDSLPFAEIVSGTELSKLEKDIAILVEKIMKG